MTDSFMTIATRLVEGNIFTFLTAELFWNWKSPLEKLYTPLLIPSVQKSSLRVLYADKQDWCSSPRQNVISKETPRKLVYEEMLF